MAVGPLQMPLSLLQRLWYWQVRKKEEDQMDSDVWRSVIIFSPFSFAKPRLTCERVCCLSSIFQYWNGHQFLSGDSFINGTELRISYEVWGDVTLREHLVDSVTFERSKDYIQAMFDQFNIREAGTSREKESHTMASRIPKQTGRPDVVFFNDASAFSLFLQKSPLFRTWVRDCRDLTAEVVSQQGQKGVPKLFWYGNPYFRGCARAKTEYLTQSRNVLFKDIAKWETAAFPFFPFPYAWALERRFRKSDMFTLST